MEQLKLLKLRHGKEVLDSLLKAQLPFRLIVVNKGISYTPPLPTKIGEYLNSQEVLTFEFANYTLENAHLEQDQLVFETGFGPENFGSVVRLPVWRVTTIALINPALGVFINPFSEEEPPTQLTTRKPRLVLR